jgi:Flp pilus assembly protein TadG
VSIFTRLEERGQILMMAAVLLPVLLAMAGMAVDVGTYASDRRALQNAADSAALAAGQELPDAAAAEAKAEEYLSDYGIASADVDITVTGGTTEPRVRVVIDRPHDFIFMGILGVENADVGAAASAGKFSYAGGGGVVPWTVTQDMVNSAESGGEVTIKYDSGSNPGNGHFGAMRIDGNGSSSYRDSGKYGATTVICADSMTNCTTGTCPGTFPTTCGENSGECDGPNCDPEHGNMTGPTQTIVDFRKANTTAECDTFDEAFKAYGAYAGNVDPARYAFGAPAGNGGRLASPKGHHGQGSHATFTPTWTNTPAVTNTPTRTNTPVPTNTAGGPANTATNTPVATSTSAVTNTPAPTATPAADGDTYGINPACNPWGAGACASQTATCSRQIFLIPIIEEYTDPYVIKGFALVFLEGYEGSCNGSSCDVKARFVKTNNTLDGVYVGDYDKNSYNHVVKLTE